MADYNPEYGESQPYGETPTEPVETTPTPLSDTVKITLNQCKVCGNSQFGKVMTSVHLETQEVWRCTSCNILCHDPDKFTQGDYPEEEL